MAPTSTASVHGCAHIPLVSGQVAATKETIIAILVRVVGAGAGDTNGTSGPVGPTLPGVICHHEYALERDRSIPR